MQTAAAINGCPIVKNTATPERINTMPIQVNMGFAVATVKYTFFFG
jgi:hypothetical protein